MAVNWTGYDLSPDLSGLAQGISGYFENKRAGEQFDRTMEMNKDQFDRDLEVRRAAAAAQGGNQFYSQVFKGADDRYRRYGTDPQGNPIETLLPEGVNPAAASQFGDLNYGDLLSVIEANRERLKTAAVMEVKEDTAAAIEEQKKIGVQRADLKKVYGDYGRAASKSNVQIVELDKALQDVSTGNPQEAWARIKKTFGADASEYENLDAAVFTLASELLASEPGIKTDFDFESKLKQLVSAKNHAEANRMIMERLKRNTDYKKALAKDFNVFVNNGGDPLEYEDLDYLEFLGESEDVPAQEEAPKKTKRVWGS